MKEESNITFNDAVEDLAVMIKDNMIKDKMI
jgi:hypothetical protein